MTAKRSLTMKSVLGPAALGALAIVATGCGGGYNNSSSASKSAPGSKSSSQAAPASPGAQATGAAAKVSVRGSKLGKILVDGTGRTLYLFLKDKGTASTCFGPCATVWPPLVTQGKPQSGAGASAAQLATTKRQDGKVQVTYHGHPLYFYADDHAPGDTTGQGLNQFGAEWYVLTPSGTKLEKKRS